MLRRYSKSVPPPFGTGNTGAKSRHPAFRRPSKLAHRFGGAHRTSRRLSWVCPSRPRAESRSLNWPNQLQRRRWFWSSRCEAGVGLARFRLAVWVDASKKDLRGKPGTGQSTGATSRGTSNSWRGQTFGCATAPVGRSMPGCPEQCPQIGPVWRGTTWPQVISAARAKSQRRRDQDHSHRAATGPG